MSLEFPNLKFIIKDHLNENRPSSCKYCPMLMKLKSVTWECKYISHKFISIQIERKRTNCSRNFKCHIIATQNGDFYGICMILTREMCIKQCYISYWKQSTFLLHYS